MQALNLPIAELKVKRIEGRLQVFDIVRNKYFVLTPEEWVRQHFLHHLINDLGYAVERMSIEMGIDVNGLKKRCDMVYFDRDGKPIVIVECKAPTVKIKQDVFDQIARYKLTLHVPYLIVTNGLEHYSCTMDYENSRFIFLKDLPKAESIQLG